jgi:hypothetical protein
MVRLPDLGGVSSHGITGEPARGGPQRPGEQLVVEAKPAVFLLGVGALDRQEAVDEETLGPSPIPLAGAGDVTVGVDPRAPIVRPRVWRRSCGPRAVPAPVLEVVRARVGVAEDGARGDAATGRIDGAGHDRTTCF